MIISEQRKPPRPRSQWAFLLHGSRSPGDNMEIDRTLLEWAESCSDPVTWVRFYGWSRPAISLGKHQKAEKAVDLSLCRQLQIEVVPRPTGGRAVLHDQELTYAVVSNDARLFSNDIQGTYYQISRALQRGLARLGIVVRLSRGRANGTLLENSITSPCFVSASRHELVWRGRKIVGSAQRRLRRSFLQHGSIPLSINYELMAQVFGIEEMELRRTITSVRQAAAKTIDYATLSTALKAGFEEEFEVCLQRPPSGGLPRAVIFE